MNKFIETVKSKLTLKNKTNIVVLVGILGLLIILLTEFPSSPRSTKNEENDNNFSNAVYVDRLEKKTSKLISSINGVGRCTVMITIQESSENVYAKNVDENNQHGYFSQNNEYVLYKDEKGQNPVLIKENYPKITGVAVICDGADKIEVKKQIIDTITSLFNITSSHISVSKIKQ